MVQVIVKDPCVSPVIKFTVVEKVQDGFTHLMSGTITGVANKSDVTVSIDGVVDNTFTFVPSTGILTGKYYLKAGTRKITVTAKNDCGNDTELVQVIVKDPCVPPVINFTVTEKIQDGFTHLLSGTITNVANKSGVTVTVDGVTNNSYTFVPSTGQITGKYNLTPGSHKITVIANNDCGRDEEFTQFTYEEKACGPRINPGNADWEFCLITPDGTFNRSDLSDNNFSYSGPATSLFFKAIAGGGDAIVSGSPFSIESGKYYLFTGNLQVNVSRENPGSMGQWSVCITSNKAPTSGVGNSRPKSPCEVDNKGGGSGSEVKGGGGGTIPKPKETKGN
jgi:hypothetical protein